MKPYDLTHMTDAQLWELNERLEEEMHQRQLDNHIAMQVGHYLPADKAPPAPVINHY